MIDAPTRQDCVIAGFALAAVLSSLLFLSPATAQIAVTDPPVETSTAATASELLHTNQILSQDVQVNTQTAQSLTTPGGAGAWQSDAAYLNSLAANLNKTARACRLEGSAISIKPSATTAFSTTTSTITVRLKTFRAHQLDDTIQ
jgi:hypothetical protein